MNDGDGTWFREHVEGAIREANDPKADGVSHAQAKAGMAARRDARQRRYRGAGSDPSQSNDIDRRGPPMCDRASARRCQRGWTERTH